MRTNTRSTKSKREKTIRVIDVAKTTTKKVEVSGSRGATRPLTGASRTAIATAIAKQLKGDENEKSSKCFLKGRKLRQLIQRASRVANSSNSRDEGQTRRPNSTVIHRLLLLSVLPTAVEYAVAVLLRRTVAPAVSVLWVTAARGVL